MSTTEKLAFDTEALRRGIEERDAATLSRLYADDAELHLVDTVNSPSSPRILRGADAIGAHLADIAARDMTHHVDRMVVTAEHIAYVESCRYPDGTRVLCAAVLDLDGGRITRELGVRAWDGAR
ncbi:nuclear transport factor 2 family protein [Actinokineospora sp. HUAS TT18]|uniref:nuclear transport factor 2 family protein n=1 Tax=Actinokineospora sp. HUAS TT18 TaxID=3447451 RepID=UPI003F522D22